MPMIRSFRSKALEAFFRTGSSRRLSVRNVDRVRRMLLAIDDADEPEDLNLPGYYFHMLTGDQRGRYSVRVTGNWRITFEWDQGAVEVDLEDYH
jgi:proteic killer suppression protein